jgi:hypothetical protein
MQYPHSTHALRPGCAHATWAKKSLRQCSRAQPLEAGRALKRLLLEVLGVHEVHSESKLGEFTHVFSHIKQKVVVHHIQVLCSSVLRRVLLGWIGARQCRLCR